MPNPADFIFHSDWLTFQNYDSYTFTVVTSSSVAGGGSSRSTSATTDTGTSDPIVHPFVSWNGSSVGMPSGKYSQMPLLVNYSDGSTLGFPNIPYSVFPSVEVSGSSIRAVVTIPNPYSSSLTFPAKTFNFTVRVYIPPASSV